MKGAAQVFARLDAWVDAHFENQIAFLQALIRLPTDTPPGNNAPHAELVAQRLSQLGLAAEQYPVPTDEVRAYGMDSITNVIVRRRYGDGPTIALNAHGDVVPPGPGWQHPPYGGLVENGAIYGRAAAVSKSDITTFSFATLALESLAAPLRGSVELHFTYDEEFGGEKGPQWLLQQGLSRPDLFIAAGFSYQVVTAHNGCLQLELHIDGEMAHAAIPDSGTDALQAATHIMQALYAYSRELQALRSKVPGIGSPYLNIGSIQGGTNTNVVPGQVVLKLDRRMIPEEDPQQVEADLLQRIEQARQSFAPVRGGREIDVNIRRLLLCQAMKPLPGNKPLVNALQTHGLAVFGEKPVETGSPLYTDARLYTERGIPGVLYGAGPRTLLESHAKRADERLQLEDLRGATKVLARTLLELLG